MSDDSDSDIEDLFQQAKAKQQAKKQTHSRDFSSDGEDSGDSVVNAHLVAALRHGRPKRKKGSAVEDRLQLMSQKKAMRESRNNVRVSTSNDSDDDDDDEIQVIGASMKSAGSADEDSNSDDDDVQCVGTRGRPSIHELQERGVINHEDVSELKMLKAAAFELQQSSTQEIVMNAAAGHGACISQQRALLVQQQQQRVITRGREQSAGMNAHTHEVDAASVFRNTQRQQYAQQNVVMIQRISLIQQQQKDAVAAAPLVLCLTVKAMISKILTGETTEKACVVTVLETDTVQVVTDKVLEQLRLSSKTNAIGLQFNGQTLHNRQPLDMFGIPVRATLQAVIHSSDFASGSSGAATTVDVGKIITLSLRRHIDGKAVEDCMKVGMKEKLQALVDRYAKAKGLSKVILHFDGDTINLNNTPAAYDMEDEDLIDVLV